MIAALLISPCSGEGPLDLDTETPRRTDDQKPLAGRVGVGKYVGCG